MEALDRANDVRILRARLKQDMKIGRTSGLSVLTDPPAFTETMKVLDLLLAVPKVGRVKALKTLNVARISPAKTIGGMTQRQRDDLALIAGRWLDPDRGVSTKDPTNKETPTMSKFTARQGDILIVSTRAIPKGLKEIARENGRVVLAHGEATGHAHVIDDPSAMFLGADLEEMADRFLRVENECQVVHDEHDAITLPPGDYIVRRQREYSPEAIRNVAD